jgi:hypothetical protein
MIDQAIYTYISGSLIPPAPVYFGSLPPGLTLSEYIIMYKISDEERPETLCVRQGDTGRAMFQFSGYAGASGEAANPIETVTLLEDLKGQIAAGIWGVIGTAPNDYRIWNNITTGVRLLGEGLATEGVWGAFFESTLWWEKI